MIIKVLAVSVFCLVGLNLSEAIAKEGYFLDISAGPAKHMNHAKNDDNENTLNPQRKSLSSGNVFQIGFGREFNSGLITKLAFIKFMNFKSKQRSISPEIDYFNDKVYPYLLDVQSRFKLDYDLFELGLDKQFIKHDKLKFSAGIGVGLGIAKPKKAWTRYASRLITEEAINKPIVEEVHHKTKRSYNLALSIGANVSYEITDNLEFIIIDSRYRRLGEYNISYYSMNDSNFQTVKNKINILSATSGLRFFF